MIGLNTMSMTTTFARLNILVLAAALSFAAAADVYRSVDSDGNVTYSDQPHEGAKKVEVTEPTIIPSTRSQIKLGPEKKPKQAEPYTSIEIINPANEATLRNVQTVSVSAELVPRLQTSFGHRAQILLDGSPVSEPGRALSVTLNQVDRGAHSLQLIVLDRQGNTVASSPVSQFFLHQNFVRPGN